MFAQPRLRRRAEMPAVLLFQPRAIDGKNVEFFVGHLLLGRADRIDIGKLRILRVGIPINLTQYERHTRKIASADPRQIGAQIVDQIGQKLRIGVGVCRICYLRLPLHPPHSLNDGGIALCRQLFQPQPYRA